MGLILALVLLVLTLIMLGIILDRKDRRNRRFILMKQYDVGQKMIAEFTKNKFNESYGLFRLFYYMIKVNYI